MTLNRQTLKHELSDIGCHQKQISDLLKHGHTDVSINDQVTLELVYSSESQALCCLCPLITVEPVKDYLLLEHALSMNLSPSFTHSECIAYEPTQNLLYLRYIHMQPGTLRTNIENLSNLVPLLVKTLKHMQGGV